MLKRFSLLGQNEKTFIEWNKMNSIILLTLIFCSFANSQNTLNTFKEISGDILNPERGWMEPGSNSSGVTLMWAKIRADNYRGKAFDQSFLDGVENRFNDARKKGVKLIPRVLYNHDGGGADAPVALVLQHIAQLKPIYLKHADVIHVVDPGFIGAWGEWHSSQNNLLEDSKRNAIIKGVLDMTPKDRMIYIRYPFYKLHFITGSYTATSPWLDSSQAFNGSDIARIGHLNDCMFYDNSDRGTYQKGINRAFGLKYIGQESPFVPYGGETCGTAGVESSCASVLKELPILRLNHLNRGFSKENYNLWKKEGCMDEITRRMGYRFVLESVTHNSEARPGGKMNLSFTVANKGFGELFNPRLLEIVLIANDGKETRTTSNVDPRWWSAGKAHTITMELDIPANLPEASYKIAFGLPDAYPSIKADPRYAVRFANEGVWDATKGLNIISSKLVISKTAPGTINPNQLNFKAFAANQRSVSLSLFNKNKHHGNLDIQYLSNQLIVHNLNLGTEPINLGIYDLNGKEFYLQNILVEKKGDFTAALPDLKKGLYMVKISSPNQSISQKITILK